MANCSKPQPLIYWQEWLFFRQVEKNYVLFLDLCLLDVGKQCRRATQKRVAVLRMTQHCFPKSATGKHASLRGAALRDQNLLVNSSALHEPLAGIAKIAARVAWSGAVVHIGQIGSAESQSSMIVISAFSCKIYLDVILSKDLLMSLPFLLTSFLPLKCPESSETVITITGAFMDSAALGAKTQSKMGTGSSICYLAQWRKKVACNSVLFD